MKYLYVIFDMLIVGLIFSFLFIKFDCNTISTNINYGALNTSAFKDSVIQLRKEIAAKEILETQVGNLSLYGPDCVGCSGHLGGGYDATGGNYMYHDEKYGDIRVVAGDKSYPYGTIVRLKSDNFETFNAIILDRGGGIGFNKKYLFDLLCSSEAEAASIGSFKNVTFEILRYGY